MRFLSFAFALAAIVLATLPATATNAPQLPLEPFNPPTMNAPGAGPLVAAQAANPLARLPRYKAVRLPSDFYPVGMNGNLVWGLEISEDILTGIPVFRGVTYYVSESGMVFDDFDAGDNTFVTAANNRGLFGLELDMDNPESFTGRAVKFDYGMSVDLGLPDNSYIAQVSSRVSDAKPTFWATGMVGSDDEETPGQVFRMFFPNSIVPTIPTPKYLTLEDGQFPVGMADNGNVLLDYQSEMSDEAQIWAASNGEVVSIGAGDPESINSGNSLVCGSFKNPRNQWLASVWNREYNRKTNKQEIVNRPLTGATPNSEADDVNNLGQIIGDMRVMVGRNARFVPFFHDLRNPRAGLVPFQSLVTNLIRNRGAVEQVYSLDEIADNGRVLGEIGFGDDDAVAAVFLPVQR